jgi:hypothetical protein
MAEKVRKGGTRLSVSPLQFVLMQPENNQGSRHHSDAHRKGTVAE